MITHIERLFRVMPLKNFCFPEEQLIIFFLTILFADTKNNTNNNFQQLRCFNIIVEFMLGDFFWLKIHQFFFPMALFLRTSCHLCHTFFLAFIINQITIVH